MKNLKSCLVLVFVGFLLLFLITGCRYKAVPIYSEEPPEEDFQGVDNNSVAKTPISNEEVNPEDVDNEVDEPGNSELKQVLEDDSNSKESSEKDEEKVPAGGLIIPSEEYIPESKTTPDELEKLCKESGGFWNSCGSSCRGAPANTMCIKVCVPYCECGGIAGFRCPEGYMCTDYLPGGAIDGMGICKLK